MKRRKKNHGLKKDLDQGSGGEYRQVHMESLERDERTRQDQTPGPQPT